jgi:DNA-binding transcriptional LysR family regulator
MDLWQLNIFCKVIDRKSFSKAGESVHLSQPTISSHIKDLEDHFECRLIDRLGKEAVPTKAGELLYLYARRLITLRDEAEAAMAEFNGKTRGHLVVGGSTIPGGYILPKIVGAFTKAYPETSISLLVGDTEKITEAVLSGEVELGIVGARTSDTNISQEKLIDDEMRLIIPSDHKWRKKKEVTFKILSKEPFIIREQGSGTLKSIQKSFAKTGKSVKSLKIVAEMGNTTAIIQGIKNRVGVSILSTVAIEDELKTGTLKGLSVEGLSLERNFYLTRRKFRTPSPLGRAFIKFLKEI